MDYLGGFRYFTEAAGEWISSQMTKPSRFLLQMEHFLGCVREGRQPRVTGEDGLAAMKIVEAAYRSAETNCSERPEILTTE